MKGYKFLNSHHLCVKCVFRSFVTFDDDFSLDVSRELHMYLRVPRTQTRLAVTYRLFVSSAALDAAEDD